MDEPKLIGVYPGSDEEIFLIRGPYGLYLQLGDKKNGIPKRAPIPHMKDPDSITVEVAAELMRYPVVMGNHPVDEKPVLLKLAKTGYIVSHRQTSAPVPKTVEPKDVDLEKALEYLSGKNAIVAGRRKKAPKLDAFDAM